MTTTNFRAEQERLGPSVALREEGTPAQPAPHWPITRPGLDGSNAPTPNTAKHPKPSAFDAAATVWSAVQTKLHPHRTSKRPAKHVQRLAKTHRQRTVERLVLQDLQRVPQSDPTLVQ